MLALLCNIESRQVRLLDAVAVCVAWLLIGGWWVVAGATGGGSMAGGVLGAVPAVAVPGAAVGVPLVGSLVMLGANYVEHRLNPPPTVSVN